MNEKKEMSKRVIIRAKKASSRRVCIIGLEPYMIDRFKNIHLIVNINGEAPSAIGDDLGVFMRKSGFINDFHCHGQFLIMLRVSEANLSIGTPSG